uniref:Xylanolytic transcriptional activator regulatory domain-containing protein n=1 Tax=Bionectria ochroleuca TaxID=29856 RepID=A0A8H7NGG6_BIOOC
MSAEDTRDKVRPSPSPDRPIYPHAMEAAQAPASLDASRPISKAYMSSLSDRISMLEGMLKDKGVQPPPASHPPKTKHDQQNKSSEPQQKKKRSIDGDRQSSIAPSSYHAASPSVHVPSPPDSRNDEPMKQDLDMTDSMASVEIHLAQQQQQQQQMPPPSFHMEGSPLRMLDPRQEDIVHRLLSNKANLSFDQLSGRLRFFGPTANSHVYAESPDQFDSREPPEQVRRAERIIRSLSTATYDYLMTNFWEYYNSVIQVIDREAFEADRDSQHPKYYSSFLHICVLAMGYRGSDQTRDDMKKISLGNRESTLHREAKYMLDIELERPGGSRVFRRSCSSVILNAGWEGIIRVGCMANRLAFDIGLHLDCRTDGMPEQEVCTRRMVMRAAVIYDKYWALFLGRPTSIKSQDISMELLSDKFSSSRPSICRRHWDRTCRGLRKVDPNNYFSMTEAEDNAYLHVVNLDRQLQNWYRRLPDHLAWKPANIKTAPYSFFLLHQQYHVSMILLHRPWAKYDTGDGSSVGSRTGSHPSPETDQMGEPGTAPVVIDKENSIGLGDPHSMVHDSRAALSRSICTQQAIRVSRIFWQHRQRFDGRKIFVTGIQHAGTSALALIAALAFHKSEADRRTYMGYLEILSDALGDMSHTYHPAARMDHLLKAVLNQVRINLGEDPQQSAMRGHGMFPLSGSGDFAAPPAVVPSRREAADAHIGGHPAKKRRPGGGSRRAQQQQQQQQMNSVFGSGGGDMGHQRHRAHADSMSFPLGSTSDGIHSFDLSFLDGSSAIDMDLGQGAGRPDDMALVTPSSDMWGLGRLPGDQDGEPRGGFEALMDDFALGPAGLSASSVLGQNSNAENGNGGTKRNEENGRAPMMDQDVAGGMSPLSMNSLMQTVEKGNSENDAAQRNHDLDFFSFT